MSIGINTSNYQQKELRCDGGHTMRKCLPLAGYIVLQLAGGFKQDYFCESVLFVAAMRQVQYLRSDRLILFCICGRLLFSSMIVGWSAERLESTCTLCYFLYIQTSVPQSHKQAQETTKQEQYHYRRSAHVVELIAAPLFYLNGRREVKFTNMPANELLAMNNFASFEELAAETTVVASNLSLLDYIDSLRTASPVTKADCLTTLHCLMKGEQYDSKQYDKEQTSCSVWKVTISRTGTGTNLLLMLEHNERVDEEQSLQLVSGQLRLLLLQELANSTTKTFYEIAGRLRDLEHNFRASISSKKHLLIIHNNLNVILTKAQDIQDLARILQGNCVLHKSVFELEGFVDELGELVRRHQDHSYSHGNEGSSRLSIQLGNNVPNELFSDRERVLRVALNLILNALQNSYGGSVVTRLSYLLAPQELELAVHDTNNRMGVHKLQALDKMLGCEDIATFIDSFKGSFADTALSLYVTSRLARHLGMHISLEHSEDTGVIYRLRLKQPQRSPSARLQLLTASEIDGRLCSKKDHRPSTFAREASDKLIGEMGVLPDDLCEDEVPLESLDGINWPRSQPVWKRKLSIERLARVKFAHNQFMAMTKTKTKLRHASFSTSNKANPAGNKILIADSCDNNRDFLHTLLHELGFVVDEAENGLVASRKAIESHYNCIFMDIGMPILNGLQAVRKIRESEAQHKLKPIPIVAMASTDQPRMIADCYQAGMNEVLIRPFRLTKIKDCIHRHLLIAHH